MTGVPAIDSQVSASRAAEPLGQPCMPTVLLGDLPVIASSVNPESSAQLLSEAWTHATDDYRPLSVCDFLRMQAKTKSFPVDEDYLSPMYDELDDSDNDPDWNVEKCIIDSSSDGSSCLNDVELSDDEMDVSNLETDSVVENSVSEEEIPMIPSLLSIDNVRYRNKDYRKIMEKVREAKKLKNKTSITAKGDARHHVPDLSFNGRFSIAGSDGLMSGTGNVVEGNQINSFSASIDAARIARPFVSPDVAEYDFTMSSDYASVQPMPLGNSRNGSGVITAASTENEPPMTCK
jgi:hypothetical protein